MTRTAPRAVAPHGRGGAARGQGYLVFLDMPVPHWLRTQARQAVQMCPSLALRLTAPAPRESAKPSRARQGRNLKLIASTPADPELDVDEAWIADLSDAGRQIPRPIT